MSGRDDSASSTLRPPGPLGLYLIIAYCVFVVAQFPFQLPLPERFFLGPFLLEGVAVTLGIAVSLVAWSLMLVGLVMRRPWGRSLGLVVFGCHSLLLLAGAIRWLSDLDGAAAAYRSYAGPGNYAVTPRAAFQIMVLPTLRLLIPSALAFVYLFVRKDLFVKRRGESMVVA